MNDKNKNALLLSLVFVVAGILFFITYQGFGSGNILSYRNIEKGLDLSGGVYIVYEAQEGDITSISDLLQFDVEINENDTEMGEDNSSEELTTVTTEESTTAVDKSNEIVSDNEPTWEEKMKSAISMIQSRLDRKGWTEASVFQEGNDRIRVEIPGIEDTEEAVSEIGQTAQLSFLDIDGNIVVDGRDVANAKQMVQQNQYGVQEIVVSLEFNDKGKEDFAIATANNIGSPILIMLDTSIISAPTVNAAITDGTAVISGGFTAESAEELSSLIRSGALPFELKILEMNTIGATLGANALSSSILGGAVGVILVLVAMLILYKASGFAASVALFIYICLMLILLNGLNVTLTLQGIAGIILSIGMAVDANVIIFERIREELRAGKTLRLSIDKGFSRAFPAIIDSNITTLIAGIVLYWLGSGSIKGFAQTLMIGILLSMFTALFVTKFILKTMVKSGVKNYKLYGGRE